MPCKETGALNLLKGPHVDRPRNQPIVVTPIDNIVLTLCDCSQNEGHAGRKSRKSKDNVFSQMVKVRNRQSTILVLYNNVYGSYHQCRNDNFVTTLSHGADKVVTSL